MANDKILPDISGDETIAGTWRRLLTRDRNTSNLFSGDDFTTDQDPVQDVGRPNWRTDLNRLFIYNGTTFISLWDYLTPQEIAYSIDHPDVPDSITDVKAILDLIVNRNMLNTVTMPAVSIHYLGNGTMVEYDLERYTNNKNTLFVFIDGVKQAEDTYELADDGLSVVFEQAPANGENIEILQLASLLEYDYSPVIRTFTGDGTTTDFVFDVDVLNPVAISVNVDDTELQKSKFSVLSDGKTVRLATAPATGSIIQITTVNKTSYVTVSANSIGTNELQDGSVTQSKLATGLVFGTDNIADGAITTAKLANSVIDSSKLEDDAVVTTKIIDKAITQDKLSDSVIQMIQDAGGGSGAGTELITDTEFSGLTTTNKTVQGAINELNSEVDSLGSTVTEHTSSISSIQSDITDIESQIGTIGTTLDTINGEVV